MQDVLELFDKRKRLMVTTQVVKTNHKEYNTISREIKRKSKQCKEKQPDIKCQEVKASSNRLTLKGYSILEMKYVEHLHQNCRQ
jgi:hypothetical protein